MHVCMHACMYAFMYVYIHACMYACIHSPTHPPTNAYIYTHTHTPVHTYIHTYIQYIHRNPYRARFQVHTTGQKPIRPTVLTRLTLAGVPQRRRAVLAPIICATVLAFDTLPLRQARATVAVMRRFALRTRHRVAPVQGKARRRGAAGAALDTVEAGLGAAAGHALALASEAAAFAEIPLLAQRQVCTWPALLQCA